MSRTTSAQPEDGTVETVDELFANGLADLP
jgi:hypothetical protein